MTLEPVGAFFSTLLRQIAEGKNTVEASMDIDFSVVAGIETINMTSFNLVDPIVKVQGGKIQTPPTLILPYGHGIMVGRKSSFTPTGSCGTVSWHVAELNRRVVVMWSAPFNFNHYDNCLAVGITENAFTGHKDKWFNKMYNDKRASFLGFRLKKYIDEISPVTYQDDDIIIQGIMGTTHKAIVKVVISHRLNNNLVASSELVLR